MKKLIYLLPLFVACTPTKVEETLPITGDSVKVEVKDTNAVATDSLVKDTAK